MEISVPIENFRFNCIKLFFLGKLWPISKIIFGRPTDFDLNDFNQRLEHFGIFRDKHGATVARGYIESFQRAVTCFDVGGNLGAFSREMNVFGSRFIIFEPNGCLNNGLHTVCSGMNYELIPEAVSNYSGNVSFSFDPAHTGGGHIVGSNPGKAGKLLDVKVTTLDIYAKKNELENCAFIKIDVEGHELEVLEGAKEVIAKFNPTICMEVDCAEASYFEKLKGRLPDYQFFSVEIPGYEFSPVFSRIVALFVALIKPRLKVDKFKLDGRYHACVFAVGEKNISRFIDSLRILQFKGIMLD